MLVKLPPAQILVTMRFLILISAVLTFAIGDVYAQDVVFHKCCMKNQSLLKVSESEDTESLYECVDREVAYANYSISITPLILGNSVQVEYGIPEDCNELQSIQMSFPILDDGLKSIKENCYDRLEVEVVNTTIKPYIPKIVALRCIKNDPPKTSEINHVHSLRKCCPRGQSYDPNYHLCRETYIESTEEWLMSRLDIDNYIYEVDHGLHCKPSEYDVELKQNIFSLTVDGSNLNVMKRNEVDNGQVLQGEWCIDRDYNSQSLVARVCSHDCEKYGAYCIRKCCPVGHHFRPRRCGSLASTCVPNEDEVLFNITDYLEPLQHVNSAIGDVMGLRSQLECEAGRVVLNKSWARDRHELDLSGRLNSPVSFGYDYCLEAFDMRRCNGSVTVTAVNCFIKSPDKNFQISFIIICITIACLALTLVVYLSLPELRNLHGRTLICHVSTMLFAFSCLARVQYDRVQDETVCTLLGYGMYFGFVAAFSWLNVMCFDIWWTFGSVRTIQPMRKANSELRRFIWYSLYAWTCASLLTLTTFLFDKYPVSLHLDADIGVGACWFSSIQNTKSDMPHYIFFVIPMGLVTCTNFVLWVLTARHCARVKSEVHRLQAGSVGERAKKRFRVDRAKYVLTGKLWVVMGAGWISELLSTVVTEPKWFWMVIDFINSLQGVFIFIILVMKPKLYYLIRKRLGCSRIPIESRLEKPDAQKNGTSSSSARTSSTILSRALSTDDRMRLSIQNNVKQS